MAARNPKNSKAVICAVESPLVSRTPPALVLSKKYEGCTISSVNGFRFNIVQLEDNSSIVWGDSRELGDLRLSTF